MKQPWLKLINQLLNNFKAENSCDRNLREAEVKNRVAYKKNMLVLLNYCRLLFLTIFSYTIAILVKLLIAYLFLLNKTCKKLFLSFFQE